MGEVAVSKNLIQKKSIINYCLHQKIHLILQQNSNQNLHWNLLPTSTSLSPSRVKKHGGSDSK